VDHGKTTLTKSLSGVWTDRHSEEIKRGISIRMGYANCTFYKCPKCPEPECYTSEPKCTKCGGKAEFLRKVSFVDAPGHETLIATMLSGAAIMDALMLVIAADEECPQPQTKEHLMAASILGIKNVIVIQNKVDIVPKEKALENKKQIETFLKSMGISAMIIPIAANFDANKDVLIAAIQEFMPTPKRSSEKGFMMYVARSFDINKPGFKISELKGGVIGGSISKGTLKIGDTVEIKPGLKTIRQNKPHWNPIKTKVISINEGEEELGEAHSGGLLAIRTELDPSLTKSDALIGGVAGTPGTLPSVLNEIDCKVHLLDLGLKESDMVPKVNEPLMINLGTTTTVGIVSKQLGKLEYNLSLKLPVVANKKSRFAIAKKIDMKWRLIGFGVIS